jgi:hypothetical protein
MNERLTQRVFLAIACCFALLLMPLPQASAQIQSGDSEWTRDANGNMHHPDENGNYIINADRGVSSSEVQSDVTREKPQDVTSQDNSDINAAPSDNKDLDAKGSNSTPDVQSDVNQNSTVSREKSQDTMTTKKTTTQESSTVDRASSQTGDTEALPRTAGELPLIGLIGMLFIAGAGATRLMASLRR